MKKIWYAFLYGDKKTKRLIGSVILLLTTALICLVVLLKGGDTLWWLGTAFCTILAIIIMQSVSFHGTGKMVEKKKKKKNSKEKEGKEKKEQKLRTTADLTKEDIDQFLITYKVGKGHIPVMVDSWKSQRIQQCPAYLWSQRNKLCLLTLEDKPRKVEVPLAKYSSVVYQPSVAVKPKTDYPDFQKPSFLGITFGGLVPTYYEQGQKTKKNLYLLGADLAVTNTSIRPILERFKLDVTIQDSMINSKELSPYYKEGYKLSVLWKDGVINTKEYKEGIKQMMQNLTEAEISFPVFLENVTQLVQSRFVTREYAEYYIELRKKNESKKGGY